MHTAEGHVIALSCDDGPIKYQRAVLALDDGRTMVLSAPPELIHPLRTSQRYTLQYDDFGVVHSVLKVPQNSTS